MKKKKKKTNKNKKRSLVLILTILLVVFGIIFFIRNINNEKIKETNEIIEQDKDENKLYKITTDSYMATMLDDGGSHTNIYYTINLKESNIKKFEDKYKGNEGWLYKNKIVYDKQLNEKEKKKIRDILENISNNSDILNSVYDVGYYIVKLNNEEEKTTNNQELKDYLNEIDNK